MNTVRLMQTQSQNRMTLSSIAPSSACIAFGLLSICATSSLQAEIIDNEVDLNTPDSPANVASNRTYHENKLALAVNAGILGFGPELIYSLHPKFNVRTGLQGFKVDASIDEDGIEYDAELTMNSLQVLVDWHPFAGGFHLSTGLIRNSSDATLNSEAQGSYTIGDTTYEGDLAINSRIHFPTLAPYFGIGWGNRTESRFNFYSSLGVILAGEPELDISASGTANEEGSSQTFDVTTNEKFQSNLQDERQALVESLDLENFKLIPSANIGVSFRF